MMLTQKQISVPMPVPQAPMVPFVKPLSYEFRVAEMVDENDKITSVKLQMQVWEHDEYGIPTIKSSWADVPRIKMDKNGLLL